MTYVFKYLSYSEISLDRNKFSALNIICRHFLRKFFIVRLKLLLLVSVETSVQDTRAFLGEFAKLHQMTIILMMSVCLFVCPTVQVEQLDFHWTDFLENFSPSIFRKSVIIFMFR